MYPIFHQKKKKKKIPHLCQICITAWGKMGNKFSSFFTIRKSPISWHGAQASFAPECSSDAGMALCPRTHSTPLHSAARATCSASVGLISTISPVHLQSLPPWRSLRDPHRVNLGWLQRTPSHLALNPSCSPAAGNPPLSSRTWAEHAKSCFSHSKGTIKILIGHRKGYPALPPPSLDHLQPQGLPPG